jgi:ATP:corrinoid adenosyltransferase
VVEAQPSLLVLDEANPLADWARLDTEELSELIKVRHTARWTRMVLH